MANKKTFNANVEFIASVLSDAQHELEVDVAAMKEIVTWALLALEDNNPFELIDYVGADSDG